MRFGIDGKLVFAKFSYDRKDEFNTIVTICNLEIYGEINPINEELDPLISEIGECSCDSRDRFVKDIGRKLALERAMFHAKLDRSFRTKIWAAYLGRKNDQTT